MRRVLFLKAVGLCLGAALALSPALAGQKADKPASPTPAQEAGCGNHGTSVQFLDTPQAAAKQAAKEQKLVFVLHVSGNFEDPGLT